MRNHGTQIANKDEPGAMGCLRQSGDCTPPGRSRRHTPNCCCVSIFGILRLTGGLLKSR